MKIHEHVKHYAHKFFEHAREPLRKKEDEAKHAHKLDHEQTHTITTNAVEMTYKKAEQRHALIRHAVSMHKKHHFARGQSSPRESNAHPLVAHAVKGFKSKHGKPLQGAKK